MIEESINAVQDAEKNAAALIAEAQERARSIKQDAELEATSIEETAREEAAALRIAAEQEWQRFDSEQLAAAQAASIEDFAGTAQVSDNAFAKAIEAAKKLALA